MTKRIFTVGQINRYLCSMLDEDEFLADLSVSGEISNFKRHSSGHLYFTLKDSQSTLYAIMFRNAADKISFSLQDGDKVVVHGRIGVYEAGGRYQLYVNSIP